MRVIVLLFYRLQLSPLTKTKSDNLVVDRGGALIFNIPG
jgi:hypothetical protein